VGVSPWCGVSPWAPALALGVAPPAAVAQGRGSPVVPYRRIHIRRTALTTSARPSRRRLPEQ
jgi:hypothetical protein